MSDASNGARRAAIYPVILSGGSGQRLWPMSRQARPKQFLPLAGPHPLLVDTALRVANVDRFAAPLLIANRDHGDQIDRLAPRLPRSPLMTVLEPQGRNTAAAVAVALRLVEAVDPGGLVLIMPSDHAIDRPDRLNQAIDQATAPAREGWLMTFGIVPTRPDTGFGYIHCGKELPDAPDAFQIARFIEKPPLARARAYVAAGDYYWNSGIFLLSVAAGLEAFRRHAPEVLSAIDATIEASPRQGDVLALDPGAFGDVPALPFDVAIMEKADHAAMVPGDFGWSDLGSWQAIWSQSKRDGGGTAHHGDVVSLGASNSYLHNLGDRLMVAIDVDGLAIIDTGDVVAVFPLAGAARVGEAVDRLVDAGRDEAEGAAPEVTRLVLAPGQAVAAAEDGRPSAGYWFVLSGWVTARLNGREETIGGHNARPLAWADTGALTNSGDQTAVLLVFGTRPGSV